MNLPLTALWKFSYLLTYWNMSKNGTDQDTKGVWYPTAWLTRRFGERCPQGSAEIRFGAFLSE